MSSIQAREVRIPPSFTIDRTHSRYCFAIIQTQVPGIYRIAAAIFRFVEVKEGSKELRCRLLGKPPAKGFWEKGHLFEEIKVIKADDENKTATLVAGFYETITNDFLFLKENMLGLKGLGKILLVKVPNF
ncbi:MAG: hypothetical protein K1060chlam2_01165 [Chlamydiae bacterium]|nr:hypothetical protein [Chlamydiota bacterium]